jgi:hypothetical protein
MAAMLESLGVRAVNEAEALGSMGPEERTAFVEQASLAGAPMGAVRALLLNLAAAAAIKPPGVS